MRLIVELDRLEKVYAEKLKSNQSADEVDEAKQLVQAAHLTLTRHQREHRMDTPFTPARTA